MISLNCNKTENLCKVVIYHEGVELQRVTEVFVQIFKMGRGQTKITLWNFQNLVLKWGEGERGEGVDNQMKGIPIFVLSVILRSFGHLIFTNSNLT